MNQSVLPTLFDSKCGNYIFSVTQILREIKVGMSRVTKFAILTFFEDQNFDFYEFLHFLKAEIYQISKLQST